MDLGGAALWIGLGLRWEGTVPGHNGAHAISAPQPDAANTGGSPQDPICSSRGYTMVQVNGDVGVARARKTFTFRETLLHQT